MNPEPKPLPPEPTEFTIVMPPRPPGTVIRIPSVRVVGGPLPEPILESDEPDTPIVVGPKYPRLRGLLSFPYDISNAR